jgi:hypothetical protein
MDNFPILGVHNLHQFSIILSSSRLWLEKNTNTMLKRQYCAFLGVFVEYPPVIRQFAMENRLLYMTHDDLPIQHGDVPVCYVKLPDGKREQLCQFQDG